MIEGVLKKKTWLLRENSNTQLSPSLLNLYLASQAKEEFVLKEFYSKEVARHHREGSIYIHTLHDPFKPYCSGIDARIFLIDGLKFPHCTSRPARHFISAVYQSMAFIFYSQLFFSGAQAIDYYNWFLAPYLHYDNLDYQQTKEILQGFVFQLNQSNRTGAQSAFSNIGMRIKCPPYLGKERVIFAGKRQKETYPRFEKEARTIYKVLMEVMSEGDGRGAPFTFPIITTAVTRDFDWSDELVDVTLDAASKTGAPYFLNLSTDYLDEKYVHAMCCHLLVEHSGGIWQAGGLGVGSNKVVTLNLPHIALKARQQKDFFKKLDKEIEVARKALKQSNRIVRMALDKWKILPWLKMNTEDGTLYYNFEERRLTFGVIGLNECLLNLIKKPLCSKEGLKLGSEIIAHLADYINTLSKKDNMVYTLEQTPAESASFRLAKKDRARFGKRAHTQGRGQAVYYSNSTHLPYKQDISIFDKVEIEARFHPYFTGGAIHHLWIGEERPSRDALKNLVKKLSRTKLAYFAFSPDFSICSNGHLSRGRLKTCPQCRSRIVDYINRVVGYFTRVSNWNPGKQAEYKERKRVKI